MARPKKQETVLSELERKTLLELIDCKPRHRHQEFLSFLKNIHQNVTPHLDVHVITDNHGPHKHPTVWKWLAEHPRFTMHFTPTYSSWLNQIELWFSKIERDVIARGIFSSVKDLKRKIMRYIKLYNTKPKPIKWTYKDTRNRISTNSTVTGH